jgi:hypothetical protein
VPTFVASQEQEHADADQEDGPDGLEANSAITQFLQLKGDAEQCQESSPEAPVHIWPLGELVDAEVDEQERPKLRYLRKSELVEQENDTQSQDDDPDDEMPIWVP